MRISLPHGTQKPRRNNLTCWTESYCIIIHTTQSTKQPFVNLSLSTEFLNIIISYNN